MKKTKKILSLTASLLALTLVGCGGGGETSSEALSGGETSISDNTSVNEETSSAAVVDTGLNDAVDALSEVLKSVNKVTTANFTLPAIVDTLDYTYNVDWSLSIHEGGLAEAVALGEKANNLVTINIQYSLEYNTKDTIYDLTANVIGASSSKEISFTDFKVPQFKISTIAEWIEAKDTTTPTAIQGVVSAVNKTTDKSAFTLTDDTGTVFSYDSPSEQLNVGDEVVITSIYSDYNGFPQLKSPTVVKRIGENQLSKIDSKMETIDINTIASNLASYYSDPTSISTKYLKITGGYVYNNGGYATLAVSDTANSFVVNIYYHSSSEIVAKVGAQVDIVCTVRGVGSSYITVQVQSYEVMAESTVVTEDEPAVINTTIADLVANVPTESKKQIYVATGKWATKDGVDASANTYGNGTLSDDNGNSITIYGLASSKEAAGVEWVANSYSYSNPKDFLSTEIKDGDEIKLGLLYDATYKNYSAFIYGDAGGDTGGDSGDVNATKIELTTTSLNIPSNAYSNGEATVNGVTFTYIQLANYGNGIQVRDNAEKSSTSIFYNTTAFEKGIEKIELTYNSSKTTYANDNAEIFSFANESFAEATTVATYETKLSTAKDTKTYTITPDSNTYTYMRFEHDISYSCYWDSIVIYLVD